MNRFNLVLAVLLTAALFLPIQALDTLTAEVGESPAVYEDVNNWEWFSLRNFIGWMFAWGQKQ